ncbi:MAG TPA: thiolase family protein [Baekduia sp.]|nr:thiolase family protein [Baekduia sp.]
MSPLTGREVVLVEAARTPIGRGHPADGWLRDVHAVDLLAACCTAVLERAGIEGDAVDAVLCGGAQPFGEQAANVARNGWLRAGLPVTTPATTVDCGCSSAQQAVGLATALVASGAHDVVVAAGVEHMSAVGLFAGVELTEPLGTPWPPQLRERHAVITQGEAAERIAVRWGISRADQDELALRSHRLAQRATDEGRFTREVVPVQGAGEVRVHDQGIRADTSLEALAALPGAFSPDGTITAGNASQISDGAAAVLLMERGHAQRLGLRARAVIADVTAAAVDPGTMLTGPIPATEMLLQRNGLTIDVVDRFEVNEAFASVLAAWIAELGPDVERVNACGGAIALGHPLGSTGARLITTLLHELERADLELGVVAMCAFGGMGTGTLVRRIET